MSTELLATFKINIRSNQCDESVPLRPPCTNDDQAGTEFKFDPDLSSVTIIFVAPMRFIAERALNTVQL